MLWIFDHTAWKWSTKQAALFPYQSKCLLYSQCVLTWQHKACCFCHILCFCRVARGCEVCSGTLYMLPWHIRFSAHPKGCCSSLWAWVVCMWEVFRFSTPAPEKWFSLKVQDFPNPEGVLGILFRPLRWRKVPKSLPRSAWGEGSDIPAHCWSKYRLCFRYIYIDTPAL